MRGGKGEVERDGNFMRHGILQRRRDGGGGLAEQVGMADAVESGGKAFKAAGIEKDYSGAYSIWNPSEHRGQSMDVKEVGAQACAQVFKNYGFRAYMDSRAD